MTSDNPDNSFLQKVDHQKNTKLGYLELENVEPDEIHYTARTQNGALTTNYVRYGEKLAEELELGIFVMDDEDIHWMEGKYDLKNDERPAVTRSLTEFMSERPQKKIYVRKFYLPIDGFRTESLLIHDVLEIIPLVWKKQINEDISLSAQGIVDKYCGQNDVGSMISVTVFESILQELDVNKSLITLITDFEQYRRVGFCLYYGMSWFYYLNHHGEYSMFYINALQAILQTLVFGINWTVNLDRHASRCRLDYKNQILELMEKYSSRNQSSQVPERTLRSEVGRLTDHIFYQKQMNRSFKNKACYLRNTDANSKVDDLDYKSICRKFALPNFRKLKSEIPLEDIKLVFMTRIFYALGFMERFLDGRNEHLRKLLLDGFFDLTPLRAWEYLRRFFNHKYGTNYNLVDSIAIVLQGETDSEARLIDKQATETVEEKKINENNKEISKPSPLPNLCLNDIVDEHDKDFANSSDLLQHQASELKSDASIEAVSKQEASEKHETTSTSVATSPKSMEAINSSENVPAPAKSDNFEAEKDSNEHRKMAPDNKILVETSGKQIPCSGALTPKEMDEQKSNLAEQNRVGALLKPQHKSSARCSPLVPNSHCIQCYENLGKRKKAEEELRKSEKMAKQNESQAMKYEQLVKDYAKLEGKLESAQNFLVVERRAKEQAQKQAAKTKEAEVLENDNKGLRQQLQAQAEQIIQKDEALKKMKNLEEYVEKHKETVKLLSGHKETIFQECKKLMLQNTSNEAIIAQYKITIDEMKTQGDISRNLIDNLMSQNDILEREAKEATRGSYQKRSSNRRSQTKPPLISTCIASTSSSLPECSRPTSSGLPPSPPFIRPSTVRPLFNQNTFNVPSTSSAILPPPANSPRNPVPEESDTEETECGICFQPIVNEQPRRCSNEKCSFLCHEKCVQTWIEYKKQPFFTACVHCTKQVADDKEFPKL